MAKPRDIKLGYGVRFRIGKGYYLVSPSVDGKAFYITAQQARLRIEPYSYALVFVDCIPEKKGRSVGLRQKRVRRADSRSDPK